MTTARDIVTKAMRRLAILEATESPDGAELRDGLDALNSLIYAWEADGCDVAHQGFTANSNFDFWLPPKWDYADPRSEHRLASALHAQTYAGAWDADANTPALTSTSGTLGELYRVETAGTTALGSVSAWNAGDWLMFDGSVWIKGQSPNRVEGGVVAMLAVRIAEDYGKQVTPVILRDAEAGERQIEAAFTVAPDVRFDLGITRVSSRRTSDWSLF